MNNNDLNKNAFDHVHDENCNHDHEYGDYDGAFEDVETIVLTLNDDTELECIVLGIFDVEGLEYIALVTIDDEQVLLYRYIEESDNEGDFTLENIDSDEEFDKASKIFFEIFSEDEENLQ